MTGITKRKVKWPLPDSNKLVPNNASQMEYQHKMWSASHFTVFHFPSWNSNILVPLSDSGF